MAYVKQQWENLPAETTPLSAARLAHMETQYDEAVAEIEAGLNSQFTTYRIWDGTAYPPRVPGSANLFIGPVNPGLAMDPVMDVWANPESTTVAEVTAEVQDVSSDLHAAVVTASTPLRVEFTATDFAAVDNRPPTMGTLSPSANLAMGVPVLLFGDNTVQVAGTPWRTPVGWSAARVYVDWAHTVTSPASAGVSWQARVAPYTPGTALSVTTGLQTLAQVDNSSPAAGNVRRFLISGNFALDPAGSELRVAISRLSTAFGGSAGLIKLILERTA